MPQKHRTATRLFPPLPATPACCSRTFGSPSPRGWTILSQIWRTQQVFGADGQFVPLLVVATQLIAESMVPGINIAYGHIRRLFLRVHYEGPLKKEDHRHRSSLSCSSSCHWQQRASSSWTPVGWRRRPSTANTLGCANLLLLQQSTV